MLHCIWAKKNGDGYELDPKIVLVHPQDLMDIVGDARELIFKSDPTILADWEKEKKIPKRKTTSKCPTYPRMKERIPVSNPPGT